MQLSVKVPVLFSDKVEREVHASGFFYQKENGTGLRLDDVIIHSPHGFRMTAEQWDQIDDALWEVVAETSPGKFAMEEYDNG